VVYDLSNTPYVDVAGARMLRRLHDELSHRLNVIHIEGIGEVYARKLLDGGSVRF
jgi:hypothetical protein